MAGVASNGLCSIASAPSENAAVSTPEVVQVISGIATENNYVENLDSFDKRMAKIGVQTESDVKRKGILVQEVDEGQPCLNCKEKCTGFAPHKWRNICRQCKCLRELHDIYHGNFVNVRERLGWEEPADTELQANKEQAQRLGYSWVPPGLSDEKVDEYLEQLDNNKIPRVGSVGEKYRDLQLILQLPTQDLAADRCRQLKGATERKAFNEFVDLRDSAAMDVGFVRDHLNQDPTACYNCDGEIDVGELAVFAPKFIDEEGKRGDDHGAICWHPACFMCCICEEQLVDLVYCHNDSAIYCQRHYAQLLKPRCAACDELIFSGEYTKAMDQDWHSGHFSCWNCDMSLTGHRYILREEHPYCIKCYENLFANSCEECKVSIGTDSKDLSYKDRHWHEKCFKCCDCQGSLVDQPFASKDDKLYCADCHDNNFAARCDGCGEVFRAGMKKYEYKGKQWHEQCFCCKVCQQPIGNKSFIPHDQEIVCVPCYEDQYAQKCAKCSGVINKGGITYKATPWHRECFTCTNCDKILAGEKFTSREEKPYCAECFGDLFAKKCCKCSKPITGLGGTKFISFEERHWHSDCFSCYKCSCSLVGRGFLTDSEDILCPECGRA